ncbi:hypothetical protein RRK58_001920 [Vibrio fluvialis]|nr:hypothetical protein [Vibrio fluvialis]
MAEVLKYWHFCVTLNTNLWVLTSVSNGGAFYCCMCNQYHDFCDGPIFYPNHLLNGLGGEVIDLPIISIEPTEDKIENLDATA